MIKIREICSDLCLIISQLSSNASSRYQDFLLASGQVVARAWILHTIDDSKIAPMKKATESTVDRKEHIRN